MSHELIRLIDAWAANTRTTRSEAIRRLVEQALLKDDPDQKQATRKTGLRAPTSVASGVAATMITAAGLAKSKRSSQMAAEAIDRLSDKSASVEERERRKRRLIKGPPEFRDVRGDLPKSKR